MPFYRWDDMKKRNIDPDTYGFPTKQHDLGRYVYVLKTDWWSIM